MAQRSSFYFSDFALASGLDQCGWCGNVMGLSELSRVQIDEADGWTWLCLECREQVETHAQD